MAELRKYGLSLLDQNATPIGIQAGEQRLERDREVKNQAQEIKRMQRVGRRAYREGMRSGNFGKAMDALDWTTKNTGSTGAGIGIAGALEQGLRQRNDWSHHQMDAVMSRQPQDQPTPVTQAVPVLGGILGTQIKDVLPMAGQQPPTPFSPIPNADPQHQTMLLSGLTAAPSGASIKAGVTNYAQGPLGQRQQLFDAMTARAGIGQDPRSLSGDANTLGIDPKAFERASLKAQALGTKAQGGGFSTLLASLYNY